MAKNRRTALLAASASRASVRVVSATEAKNKFGEVIRDAYESDQQVIVEKGGIPVVAIISMSDYDKLLSTQAGSTQRHANRVSRARAHDEAVRRLRSALAVAHARLPDVSEDEVERDVQLAIDEVRRKRR